MVYWVALFVLNLPILALLGWVIFGGWAGLAGALAYLFTPNGLSFLRGEHADHVWGELKILLCLAAWIILVLAEHRHFGPALRSMMQAAGIPA